jgi:secretion/DNA translocation related TadE-like protein
VSGSADGRRAPPDDAGTATVLAAAAVGVLVLLLGLGLQVGAATLARHRAETAADLGALAGAREAVRGRDVACARADAVVAGNGARLVAAPSRAGR